MKIMKNIIKRITIGALLLLLVQSCSDFLNTTPSDRASTEIALLTIRDANLAVSGMYDGMKMTDYYGAPITLMGDHRGDDFQPRSISVGGWNEIYSLKYESGMNTYFGIWNKSYTTIMKANYILEAWDKLEAQSADEIAQKNDIKGQALAVRALCHFNVVICYGYPYAKDNGQSLGAVIVDKTLTPNEAIEIKRSSVAETYAFILNDLQTALPLLFKPNSIAAATALPNSANEIPGRLGKLNYWGAKMLQARAYLYMGQWENAFNAAREVITDSPYRLASNSEYLSYLATEGGVETIFELLVGNDRDQDMDENNNFDGLYNYIWHASPALARLIPTQAWLDIMAEDPDDVRGKVISFGDGAEGSTWIRKFPGIDGDFKRNNHRVFRLAEAYLIGAETALKLGRQSDADAYLDAIRQRANPDNPTITCTLDDVLKERRKELIAEGHRFFDLMRLGMTVSRIGGFHFAQTDNCPETFDWNYFKVVLPISSANRLIYPLCEQNPGYSD